MRADLHPLFGLIPENSHNLEIVGEFSRRFEIWEKAMVWPRSGVVAHPNGQVVTESIWINENLLYCGDFHSRWSLLPRTKKGVYFNLNLFWGSNYYHWHCDVLTRLVWALPQFPLETQVILPPALTSWQKRSLELVGLKSSRCVTYKGRRPWELEKLVWASPLTMTGDHEPQSLQKLRKTVFDHLGHEMPQVPGTRKLYLTRRNTHGRRVTNEEEVLPLLLEKGFEAVDCGQLSYDEQVRMFSEAGVVVAPHGAALTNLLWSPPDTQVFEIFEPGTVRRCYWSLCGTLKHSYHCAIGKTCERTDREADMIIDLQDFAAALKKILS
jgi:capsular polysaccharide biosynthesis protein